MHVRISAVDICVFFTRLRQNGIMNLYKMAGYNIAES
jgi:hypothetical protein